MTPAEAEAEEVPGALNREHAAGSIEGWPVINASGMDDETVLSDGSLRELARSLSRWVDNARAAAGRSSLYDPNAYTPPDNWYRELSASRHAMEADDIVGGVHEITEGFAFQGVKWEGSNPDEVDVMNQISRDIDLDRVIREMWFEEFQASQFVVAMTWGTKTYKVRGRTAPDPEEKFDAEKRKMDPLTGEPLEPEKPRPKGRKRRKTFTVYCPIAIDVLDSACVVPVMQGALRSDALAWSTSPANMEAWERTLRGDRIDPEMLAFYLGRFNPDEQEEAELVKLGVDVKSLMLLNPQMVWRHTRTRPGYRRFAGVRLKSLFRLLDLKQQLLAADRASLVGSANYILLVKKGSDKQPATGPELANLNAKYNFIARMPVIISDHRLEIEIIAPKVDMTLNGEKYDTIDTRILARLLGTLTFSNRGQRNETQVTLSHAVAKGMENSRHMLKRAIEREVARAIWNHPKNEGVFEEDEEPNMVFVPRTITLDISDALVKAYLQLRTSREMSRETLLEFFGLDQSAEAQRLEFEEEVFDDVFKTIVPFSSPDVQPGQPGQGMTGTPSQTGNAGNPRTVKPKPKATPKPAKAGS